MNSFKFLKIHFSPLKTLHGHSDRVNRLIELESGELISCSSDSTIKIWNIMGNTCKRTLFGHTDSVESIRVCSKSKTLVSCSYDGQFKTWDLNTGDCVNTILVNKHDTLRDLIFI